MIETDYAKVLYAVMLDKSDLSISGQVRLVQNLRELLKRRGHEKLLPRIYSEYKKLVLAEHRRKQAATVTPAAEKTRVLLELYKKLVASG